MNTIINFVSAKVLQPIWDFLDGKKTAIAGGVSILSGAASLAAEAAPLLSAHNTAGLIQLLRGLPSDPAYLLLVAGLGAIGIGHKIDKSVDPAPKE